MRFQRLASAALLAFQGVGASAEPSFEIPEWLDNVGLPSAQTSCLPFDKAVELDTKGYFISSELKDLSPTQVAIAYVTDHVEDFEVVEKEVDRFQSKESYFCTINGTGSVMGASLRGLPVILAPVSLWESDMPGFSAIVAEEIVHDAQKDIIPYKSQYPADQALMANFVLEADAQARAAVALYEHYYPQHRESTGDFLRDNLYGSFEPQIAALDDVYSDPSLTRDQRVRAGLREAFFALPDVSERIRDVFLDIGLNYRADFDHAGKVLQKIDTSLQNPDVLNTITHKKADTQKDMERLIGQVFPAVAHLNFTMETALELTGYEGSSYLTDGNGVIDARAQNMFSLDYWNVELDAEQTLKLSENQAAADEYNRLYGDVLERLSYFYGPGFEPDSSAFTIFGPLKEIPTSVVTPPITPASGR